MSNAARVIRMRLRGKRGMGFDAPEPRSFFEAADELFERALRLQQPLDRQRVNIWIGAIFCCLLRRIVSRAITIANRHTTSNAIGFGRT